MEPVTIARGLAAAQCEAAARSTWRTAGLQPRRVSQSL